MSVTTEQRPWRFDRACLFLLSQGFENLFQPTRDPLLFSCKGCGEPVKSFQRREHFNRDKERVQDQSFIYPDTQAQASSSRPSSGGGTSQEGGTTMSTTTTTPKAKKPSKIMAARDAAVAALVKADKPLKMDELVALALKDSKVKSLGIPAGTISTQVSNALKETPARIKRIDRGTYVAVGAKIQKVEEPAPVEAVAPAEAETVAAKAKPATGRSSKKPAAAKPDPKPNTRARRTSRQASRSGQA